MRKIELTEHPLIIHYRLRIIHVVHSPKAEPAMTTSVAGKNLANIVFSNAASNMNMARLFVTAVRIPAFTPYLEAI